MDALETHFMVQLTGLPDELEVRDQGNKGTPEVLLETLLGLGEPVGLLFFRAVLPSSCHVLAYPEDNICIEM